MFRVVRSIVFTAIGSVAVLGLLSTGISTAEAKSECNMLVKVDLIKYADTKNETIDSVTVCHDGKATGFHSFTAPAFGPGAPPATKWGLQSSDRQRRSFGSPDICQAKRYFRSA